MDNGDGATCKQEGSSLASRRRLLQAAGSTVLAAGGLWLPAGVEDGEARPVDDVRHRAGKRRQRMHHRLLQRRRAQRRNHSHHGAADPNPFQRGISLLLTSHLSTSPLLVECGDFDDGDCELLAIFNLVGAPNPESRVFDTSTPAVYAWVTNRYWVEFTNPLIGKPFIAVADGGVSATTVDSRGTSFWETPT